jgi:hypothetical protein
MKLSKETLTILRNFAVFNQNIVIEPGNVVKTITEATTLLATAEVAETFPAQVAIYDLNEFVAVLGLVTDPEIEIGGTVIKVYNASEVVNYRMANVDTLTRPTRDVKMPAVDVKVTVSADALARLRKAASVLGHTVASLKSDGKTITLAVGDPKNSTANTFSLEVAKASTSATFSFDFLLFNLSLIENDYVLEVSSKMISKWTAVNAKLSYVIALERTSSYNA